MKAVVVVVAVGCAALVLAGWWLRRRLVVVTVTGRSMEPTLHHGDRVLVRRVPGRAVRTGQLVVLHWPAGVAGPAGLAGPAGPAGPASDRGDWMLKRVIAVAGEPVPPGALPDPTPPGTVVPPGRLVVRGDNVDRSHDSRQLGYLDDRLLLGVVMRRLGPSVSGQPAGSATATVAAGTSRPPVGRQTKEDHGWSN
jgi:signal peptidase I